MLGDFFSHSLKMPADYFFSSKTEMINFTLDDQRPSSGLEEDSIAVTVSFSLYPSTTFGPIFSTFDQF